MSRLDDAFARTRREDRAAFVGYLMAGFPSFDTYLDHARSLLEHVDVLEVGLPYSDPLGDGPTIQRAGEAALRGGTTPPDVFSWIETLRAETDTPLVLMSYYNPIYAYAGGGEQAFLRDLARAGADGLILPDLPPDEAETLIAAARAREIDTVFLVAPTSTRARLDRVTDACRGFVYAVSVTGVTGARDRVGAEVESLVGRVREVSELPVAVGFGVGDGQTAAEVAAFADGVVVGSALIRAIQEDGDAGPLAAEIRQAMQR